MVVSAESSIVSSSLFCGEAANHTKMPEIPQIFHESTESLVFSFYKAHIELRLQLHQEAIDVFKLGDEEVATARSLLASPVLTQYSIERLASELQPVALALKAYGQEHFRFAQGSLIQHARAALEEARRAQTRQQQSGDEVQPLERIVELLFNNVSDQLFVDGIHWRYILTFLVFGAEFAFQAVRTKAVTTGLEIVARWQIDYFDQHLANWIGDNNGWNGFIEAQQANVQGEDSRENGERTTTENGGLNLNWLEMGAGAAAGLGLLGFYLANR